MSEEIGLAFLPNPGGEAEGLSDAGVETFRDKPFAAVARETGQNSRDARSDPAEPVRMTFDILEVSANEFPDLETYRSSVELCLQKAKTLSKEKDIGFFEQASRVLKGDKITVLRISDYNTKGVRGPCVEGKPFHTLAKADGVTDKDEVDSGGSFGIGKNAVFALSDIQTAFFSTVYKDDEGVDQFLCIGKTLFVSHKGVDGEEKRRKGYWGNLSGFLPLTSKDQVPTWLARETLGTSIYAIAMRKNSVDWRHEMAAAVLVNFFAAIQRGEMEFELDSGKIKINKNTIRDVFSEDKIGSSVDKLNMRSAFNSARVLHSVIVDENTVDNAIHIDGLGDVSLKILMREGLGYTVGIIRNGMYITDNFANFNEPFKRFPLHQEFAVIIEPVGKTVGEWFKRLEGPKHNDLSAERITDPEMREKGEKYFSELSAEIRKKIRRFAKSVPSNKLELDELNDLFASENTQLEDETGSEVNPRSLKPSPIARSPIVEPPKPKKQGGENQSSRQGSKRLRSEVKRHTTPGATGEVPEFVEYFEPVTLQDERTVIIPQSTPKSRRLFFNSPVDGKLRLSVQATGLSDPTPLKIVKSSEGELVSEGLQLDCMQDQRVSLDVEFSEEYRGAVELSAKRIVQE